jgi:hypothetical protein
VLSVEELQSLALGRNRVTFCLHLLEHTHGPLPQVAELSHAELQHATVGRVPSYINKKEENCHEVGKQSEDD